jgi:transposase
LNQIQQVLATLPCRERPLYEDEVDIHLNPKIGLDWMVSGQQKEAETPGKNEKPYSAGAFDIRTGIVIWVEGERKTSCLFLDLLDGLLKEYPQAKWIHLVLDNYRIHTSEMVQAALQGYLAGKIVLHFLPPYCPGDNRIERIWQDLHANVTRNHRCESMTAHTVASHYPRQSVLYPIITAIRDRSATVFGLDTTRAWVAGTPVFGRSWFTFFLISTPTRITCNEEANRFALAGNRHWNCGRVGADTYRSHAAEETASLLLSQWYSAEPYHAALRSSQAVCCLSKTFC